MPLVLYGIEYSGHSHRAMLLLSMLGLDWRLERTPGELRRTPAFLALNPFGQVPVLVDGDAVVADSNAILVYLARKYDPADRWLPRDALGEAAVQRWLSVAAGELAFGPARARFATVFHRKDLDHAAAVILANRVFGLMEAHLEGRTFFAAERATIADLALYAYVKASPEGKLSLDPFPRLGAWLGRIEALPRFVALAAAPVIPPPV